MAGPVQGPNPLLVWLLSMLGQACLDSEADDFGIGEVGLMVGIGEAFVREDKGLMMSVRIDPWPRQGR